MAKQMSKPEYVPQTGDNLFQNVFKVIGINIFNAATEQVGGELGEQDQADIYRDHAFVQADLENMTVAVLKEVCKAKSITRTGKKAELIAKILQSGADSNQETTRIQEILMGCWFMSPVKSVGMKMGSMNEKNIEQAFPEFIAKHGNGLTVVKMKEYGLLNLKDLPEAAFSPDGVAHMRCPQRGDFLSGCKW